MAISVMNSIYALVKLKGERNDLGIVVVYRSPNSSANNDASLCDLVKDLRGQFCLVGDFNFPGIKWGTGRSDAKGRPFYEEMEENFLIQHVDEATHISGNVLDLVISKDENLVESVEHEGRLGKSDHEILMITLRTEVGNADDPTKSRDFGRANYKEMRKEMGEIDWENSLRETGVEEAWSILKGVLDHLVEKWVPWKRKKGRLNAPRWMNSEIRSSVNAKKGAWKRWKRSGRDEDKREYKKWEGKTKKLIRNRKNAYERQVARESKTNPKLFFSYINSAR